MLGAYIDNMYIKLTDHFKILNFWTLQRYKKCLSKYSNSLYDMISLMRLILMSKHRRQHHTKYAVTRIRTWVTAATTQGPNH